MATLTIERVRNGYIVSGEEPEERWVVEEADPADAAAGMLGLVNEVIGHIGGRYDEKRVHIEVRPGDKYGDRP